MIAGILEQLEELTPGWDALVFEFLARRREAFARWNEGRVDERSRPGKSSIVVARYSDRTLDTTQRRAVSSLARRGLGYRRIAARLELPVDAVRWYLDQKRAA